MQQQKITPLERLIRRVRRNKVTLFIGSGFSIKAGAPSVTDLIVKLINDGNLSYNEPVSKLCLSDVASDFVANEGRHELMRCLVKHFSFTPTDTSDHELLASIPHFKTIFTTNYDSLIEDAYPKGQCVVLTSSQTCSHSDCAPVNVYKIHGDLTTLSNTDSIIITNEDYADYFHKGSLKSLWEDLKYAFRHSYVVFIGYSLADDNIFNIVKRVRNELDSNVKGMYLISPYINSARKMQLESNGITHIELTGEEFLTKLKKSIDDTIVEDFRESRLEDNRIFYEYLQRQGLNPIVQFGDKANIIERFTGYNSSILHPELNLKVTKDVANAINQRLFNASHCIEGTKFYLPALEIDARSLINGELRYNGVLIAKQSEWNKILVLPSHSIEEVTIKIPSIGFMERTTVCVYHHENNSVVLKFDIKIGQIAVSLRFDNNKPIGRVNIETELYDTYETSSDALRWVEIPIALFEGKHVNFQYFGVEEPINETMALKEFTRAKLYYEAIKLLELENNIHFTVHNNFSEDGLMCALILRSYLIKKGIGYGLIKTFNCELEASKDNEEAQKLLKKGEPNVMAVSYVDFKGKLNGYDFKIPYVNICLMHCIVTDYHLIGDNRYSIAMVDQANENLIYGSDTPVNQEDNILHLQS